MASWRPILLLVLVTFLVAVPKYLKKSNLRERSFILTDGSRELSLIAGEDTAWRQEVSWSRVFSQEPENREEVGLSNLWAQLQ